ncbi:acyl carrier protein [Methylopila sp. M107]|uniref:acyl carrier protein n=1 Tax=Methylopila sp. M107 TaxID=1101190 RepID=UPI0004784E7C
MAQTGGGTIERKVTAIVAGQLGVDPAKIRPGSSLRSDLGADDLDQVELVMALEEEFDVSIPDDEADRAKTVGEMVALVARLKSRH